MAINDKQKIAVVDIAANTKDLIVQKLAEGYVIQSVTNLTPIAKLLIVYSTPDEI